jgi:hypothetical protein
MALVKLNNRGVRSATTFGSISALGEITFIKKLTADEDSTLSFVDGSSDVVLDDTYKEYLFTFNNMHPANDDAHFQFNMSVDSGSNYNVAKTSTFFRAFQTQTGGTTGLGYLAANDEAQGTGFQDLIEYGYNDATSSASGTLHLFNPSSTTFIKHFIANTQYRRSYSSESHASAINYVAGYGNTTSAVDAIQFKYASGNIDAGDICLYGIN